MSCREVSEQAALCEEYNDIVAITRGLLGFELRWLEDERLPGWLEHREAVVAAFEIACACPEREAGEGVRAARPLRQERLELYHYEGDQLLAALGA